jgi:hypothetical protein
LVAGREYTCLIFSNYDNGTNYNDRLVGAEDSGRGQRRKGMWRVRGRRWCFFDKEIKGASEGRLNKDECMLSFTQLFSRAHFTNTDGNTSVTEKEINDF